MYRQNHKCLSIILTIVSFMVIFFLSSVHAADLTLTWNKPDDSRVIGYNIYCGISGTDFTSAPVQTINSADQTSCLLLNLEEGQTYDFTATSLDSNGNESDFSETINYLVDGIPVDNDGDGYTETDGDCNDNDASIHPGAIELCGDGIDQDCNGSDLACNDNILTALAVNFQPDSSAVPEGFAVDSGGNFETEVGFGWINGPASYGVRDRDSSESTDQSYDTMIHVSPSSVWEAELTNGSYKVKICMGDPSFPQGIQNVQIERLNIIENKALSYDNRWIETEMVVDVDDGRLTVTFAGSDDPARLCWIQINANSLTSPENIDDDGDGYTENEGDCNDSESSIHPGAAEICGDGIDQDCNGSDLTCPEDIDNDSDGYTENQGDCNDNDSSIHPNAAEICGDGIDQDCNGSDLVCPEDIDNDGDGYTENEGDCNDSDASIHPNAAEICGDGIDQDCNSSDLTCPEDIDNDADGYTENEGDCNDNDSSIHPNAAEICGDGIDQDCNGSDLVCPEDIDNDGDGYTENEGDCNDSDASIHPNAAEICGDGIDQDCNSSDLTCPEDIDNDADGYTENEGDCNDNDSSIHPNAAEICGDGIDQDCDGSDLECLPDPSDVDDDGDGYTENEGDCNDSDASIHPGAIEICGDGIDQDCDGSDLECITEENTQDIAMETGEVDVNHEWLFVSFNNTFTNPVVVAKPASLNEDDPAVVRVRNVTALGFEVRIQEWDYLDGNHAFETVSYMVMEEGSHKLPNGILVEAGTFEENSRKIVSFNQSFNQIPVVISGVTTENEIDAVTGRIYNISLDGFSFYLTEQEIHKNGHTADETISYIAWEPSSGTVNGVIYIVDSTFNEVTQDIYSIPFYPSFNSAPVCVADMQTKDGGDVSNVRWQNKNADGIEVQIDEEQSKDSEIGHTTEVVGYMAFSVEEPANLPSLAVNFQPNDAEVPDGYVIDSGGSFDSEGGYGWVNGPSSYGARDRNIIESPDQKHDTMIHVSPSSVWEAELPNGTYTVTICMGDPGFPSGIQNVQIEDVPFIDGVLSANSKWIEKEMTVKVTDGALTVTFAGSDDPARLCWVNIK